MGDDDLPNDTDSPFSQSNATCDYYDQDEFRNASKSFQKSISLFHLNCRSLSANWESFHELVCELHRDTFCFDVIGISEVFKCDRDQRLKLPGFHELITRTRDDDNRGGVGLFIKDNINFKVRDDLSVFIPHVFESIFIEISNGSNSLSKNIVGIIYRPNTQPRADIDIFSTTLYDIMDLINNERKSCTLMGDFNIDLIKYNSHEKTNDLIDNIFSRGFVPSITKPTRVTLTSATLIDHIFTNNIHSKSVSGIIVTDVADHFGVFQIISGKSTFVKDTLIEKRSFSEHNISRFQYNLDETNFDHILLIKNAEDAYNEFIKLYKVAFDSAFPLKQIKPNRKYIKHEPWMTEGLLKSMRTKCKLFGKKLKQPTLLNISNYKIYLNLYNKLKRIMKVNFYKNEIDIKKHDIKATWQILKKAIGKTGDKPNFPKTFTIDNKPVSDRTKISTLFNNYFANIGKLTSQSVPKSKKHFSDFLSNPITNSMFLEPIEESDILNVVKKLKPKTSFGHDGISTKIMKESIINILQPITHIINISLDTGVVPSQLKMAKVIPVFKSSEPDLLKNYRPISLLPAFSKIFEKIMFTKIMSFLNSHNILYKHQYGFRSKHSTIHPLIHLLNKCAEGNNVHPKQLTMSIFCDLSKAFDVINHSILVSKLEYYGFRGIVKDWLVSYLSNRTQYVEIENNKSETSDIDCGVPQGSILGPLLYLIYVNDISESTAGSILSFADDTSLIISNSNAISLFQSGNTEINNLYDWFCANKLSLNATKTKYTILRSPTHKLIDNGLNIQIDGIPLCRISNGSVEQSTKFLGIHIDENLSWRHHLTHINKKISRALFMIKQAKQLLPPECLRTLYFAMIHPHLTYGNLAWGNANASLLNKTYLLQKRAVRIINKANYNSHTEPLFRASHILKLHDQYKYDILMFMLDYKSNNLPPSFNNVYKSNCEKQTTYSTRQSNQLNINRCGSSFAQRLPLYIFPKKWNEWTAEMPSYFELTRSQNKKYIKSGLLSTYSCEVKCSNTRCNQCTKS